MQQPTRPRKPEQQASAVQFYTQLVQLPTTVTQQASRDVPQQGYEQAAALPGLQQQPEHSQPVQQEQQQQQGPLQQHAQAARQQQMPFAPVKFSSKTHLLDPNTGTMTLPPKSAFGDADAPAAIAAATAASGSDPAPRHQQRHKQQHHQQSQQQQQQQQQLLGIQPMHPVAPAHIASSKRPIDRGNLGYKLLSKAGWQEGQGLGANEQGMAAPLAVSYHKGNTGLGFSKQQQPQQQLQGSAAAAGAAAGSSAADQQAAAAAAGAVAGPVLGGKRVAALVAAELAAEDLDTKVKRHRQLREQKAKEDRDKAIQTYLYRAFNDVEAPDSNPLLAKSHRLTATNPLLD